MKRINSLLVIIVILMMPAIKGSLYAMHGNRVGEEDNFSAFIGKYLRCFIRKQPSDDRDKEFSLKQDTFPPALKEDHSGRLESIPTEILWEICYKLSPLDILRISLASKDLKKKISADFWESYIRVYRQGRWDHFTSAIKVAFAFSLFEQGKLSKAAKLGFPKAIEFLRKEEEVKKKGQNKIEVRRAISYTNEILTTSISPIFPFYHKFFR